MKALTLSAALMIGAATSVWAQEPQSGGTLNFTAPYGSTFGTMDIQSSSSVQDEFPAKAIHRSLYDWNSETGKPELELATDVEVSDDGRTFTYTLRDATFHNGKELTTDDVIYSYKRMATPDNSFASARYFTNVEGIEAFQDGSSENIAGLKKIDDKTFSITFTGKTEPGYDLMRVNAAIYPEGAGEDEGFMTNPVGLGPFKFVENIPGSKIVVEKYEDFYEEGKPYLDTVNLVLLADASARDVAFRNGEIDVSVLGPSQYVAYQADPNLKDHILEVAEVYTRNVGFNPEFEPFSKKEVRQAFNHAINTDLIIERLVKNKAYRATGFLPISSPAYDESAEPYEYDVEKAKQLLADAGYPDGFDVTITATQNESWGLTIVEAIIPMLREAGIRVTAEPVEASVLGERVPGGDFQSFMWSNVSGPDPFAVMTSFHSDTPVSSGNYWRFDNEEFDKLYEQARDENDPEKRTDLLRQANNIIQDEAPMWFFNYNKAVMAYQPWVHGLQANATELAIQNYEDIWIDDSAPESRK
ncbi:ABC transporter substrate-binding protein [Roseovarius sp. SCSIO 43702]|uniref:ABC transporter substrate-binding protein n=1 Tax=Roseovarius sp. SCSIO 43702 TaxID=2823043 RepID=UPI001C72D2BF|nr:ABC transporter substrate-binding protein [Roseovarius sp. SCSIO 43702]QYX56906.1 ABC transporter substrate-binding protein [Roseovarius sp. SCSIO 43702]